MTIQNMFNMAKGQTLTQDGCEADVDDKRYNIGDISQKTGLQKTANGWVKPKNGKAPGAKTGPGESPKGRTKEDVKKEVIKEMSPEHIAAVMNGRTYRNVKEGRGVIDITKADLIALGKNAESKPVNDPKLAKEIENGDHFERQKKEAAQKKRDEKLRQERREGEARADDFRKKVESGEIVYNKETGKFEDGKKATESKPAEKTKSKSSADWKKATVELKNKAGQGFFLNTVAFGMTPAWARKNGYSPNDVNGSHAQNKLAEKIITSQDWSKPEDAVRKLNALNFGFNNWKVTEKQADKVKIATKDRLGNLREITIAKPKSTTDCAPRVLTKDTKIRVRKA